MSAAKMTPGPWYATFYVYQDDPAAPTGRRAQIVSDSAQVGGIMDGAHIASKAAGVADVRRHGAIAAADARAIACLPELVEAARAMVALWPEREDGSIKATPDVIMARNGLRRILARIDGSDNG